MEKPKMMRFHNFYLLFLFTLFILFGSGCLRDESPLVRQEIPVLPFHKLELRADVEVFVYHDSWLGILAEGSVESLHNLDYSFSRGRLTIRDTGPTRGDTRLHIHMPDVRLIENRSRGSIIGQNLISLPGQVELITTRKGSLDIALLADVVKVRHRGPGQLFLEGETGLLDLKTTDSGGFHGFGLLADEAIVRNGGSGDIEISVDDFMDVRITGSGNVYYTGYPGYQYEASGSGRLIQVE